HKDGSYSSVKYIIRGPVFYVAAVHHKNDNDNVKRFLESFTITPFIYPEVKTRTDTTLHFKVQSPLSLTDESENKAMNRIMEFMKMYAGADDDDDDDLPNFSEIGEVFNTKFIGNDTIGEKILITYTAPPKYTQVKDSAELWAKKNLYLFADEDTSF